MKDQITLLLLWLLGVEVPSTGEGVQWQLVGAWRWSRPVALLIILVAVLAAAYVLWFYLRERSAAGRGLRLLLTGLRLSLIMLVLLVMIFELRLNFSRTSLPYLAIAVDESASMAIVDEWDDKELGSQLSQQTAAVGLSTTSRINLVKSFLLANDGQELRELARRYTLRTYTIAGSERKQSSDLDSYLKQVEQLEAVGQTSQLGASIRGILNDLRGTQPTALIVLTDGITTQGPTLSEAAEYARRKAVPLYVAGIGSERKIRGVDMADLVVDDIVFVDDYVDFDFNLTAYGLEGQTIQLVLKDEQNGEILARSEITAGVDGAARRERISHRPANVGSKEYVIEVDNLREELKDNRPQLSRQIEVRDDPIRVLLVQSAPTYEYRYLKNLLERDTTIQLNVVLQDADLEYAQQDRFALRVFPVSRDDLFEYDVLILGDVNLSYFTRSAMENVTSFVTEKGGGIILICGSQFNPGDFGRSPLAALSPVDLDETRVPDPDIDQTEGFSIHPTLLGLTSPHMQLGDSSAETVSIWGNLPEVYWMMEAGKVRTGARVLAEHPTKTGSDGQKLPFIALYYVPPGRVLWHATDETYRWRYRLGDALFARYWVQAIRYLSRSKLLGNRGAEISSDRSEYQSGMPVQLRVRFFDERLASTIDDGVTLVVEGNEPKKRQVKLRRSEESPAIFSATLPSLPLGTYRGWLAVPALEAAPSPVTFQIVAPPGETAKREMNARDLKKAASVSRGKYFDASDLEKIADNLPPGRPVKVASMPPIPLWNNWRVLLLYLALLTCEWLLRKRAGML